MERQDFFRINVKCSVALSPAIEKYFTEYTDSIENPNTNFLFEKKSKTEYEVLFFDDKFLHKIVLTFESIKISVVPIKNINSIEIETKSGLQYQKGNNTKVENYKLEVRLNNQQTLSLPGNDSKISFSEIIELKNKISAIIA